MLFDRLALPYIYAFNFHLGCSKYFVNTSGFRTSTVEAPVEMTSEMTGAWRGPTSASVTPKQDPQGAINAICVQWNGWGRSWTAQKINIKHIKPECGPLK